jgi:hypothetical protein
MNDIGRIICLLVAPWPVLLMQMAAGQSPQLPISSVPPALPSGTATVPSTAAPARRPLDAYPAFVRPLLKYGIGGAVVAWFVFGVIYLCRQRWLAARTAAEKQAARRWIAGMLIGLGLALALLTVGFISSLRARQFDLLFWSAAPVAVVLPPTLAALAMRWPGRGKLPRDPL